MEEPPFTSLAQLYAAQLRPLSDRKKDLALLYRQQRALRLVFSVALRLRSHRHERRWVN